MTTTVRIGNQTYSVESFEEIKHMREAVDLLYRARQKQLTNVIEAKRKVYNAIMEFVAEYGEITLGNATGDMRVNIQEFGDFYVDFEDDKKND